ncbi:MAG: hypothetical protein NC430_02980 [bacterium]|nr:hypothetical protein [bacterium]MCM1424072.1 hypothetical protein [bacterium]
MRRELRNWRRILAVVLAAVMLLPVMPQTAMPVLAAQETEASVQPLEEAEASVSEDSAPAQEEEEPADLLGGG